MRVLGIELKIDIRVRKLMSYSNCKLYAFVCLLIDVKLLG
jgi:hypothetical protein